MRNPLCIILDFYKSFLGLECFRLTPWQFFHFLFLDSMRFRYFYRLLLFAFFFFLLLLLNISHNLIDLLILLGLFLFHFQSGYFFVEDINFLIVLTFDDLLDLYFYFLIKLKYLLVEFLILLKKLLFQD